MDTPEHVLIGFDAPVAEILGQRAAEFLSEAETVTRKIRPAGDPVRNFAPNVLATALQRLTTEAAMAYPMDGDPMDQALAIYLGWLVGNLDLDQRQAALHRLMAGALNCSLIVDRAGQHGFNTQGRA